MKTLVLFSELQSKVKYFRKTGRLGWIRVRAKELTSKLIVLENFFDYISAENEQGACNKDPGDYVRWKKRQELNYFS